MENYDASHKRCVNKHERRAHGWVAIMLDYAACLP